MCLDERLERKNRRSEGW